DLEKVAGPRAAQLRRLDGGAAAFRRGLRLDEVVHRAHLLLADRAAEREAGLLEAFLGRAAGDEHRGCDRGHQQSCFHIRISLWARLRTAAPTVVESLSPRSGRKPRRAPS